MTKGDLEANITFENGKTQKFICVEKFIFAYLIKLKLLIDMGGYLVIPSFSGTTRVLTNTKSNAKITGINSSKHNEIL